MRASPFARCSFCRCAIRCIFARHYTFRETFTRLTFYAFLRCTCTATLFSSCSAPPLAIKRRVHTMVNSLRCAWHRKDINISWSCLVGVSCCFWIDGLIFRTLPEEGLLAARATAVAHWGASIYSDLDDSIDRHVRSIRELTPVITYRALLWLGSKILCSESGLIASKGFSKMS